MCYLLYRFRLNSGVILVKTYTATGSQKEGIEWFQLTLLVSEVDPSLDFLFWLVLVLFAYFRVHPQVDFYRLVDFQLNSNPTNDFSNLVLKFVLAKMTNEKSIKLPVENYLGGYCCNWSWFNVCYSVPNIFFFFFLCWILGWRPYCWWFLDFIFRWAWFNFVSTA